MPDTTVPRLPSADAGTQPGYAPISWTAVASLAIAVLYIVVLASMAWGAADKNQTLIQPWLLFLPALAVVLAFVARRQILASEGTRTGLTYANAGWWIAVAGGLGYVAYLLAIDFAVRRQAEREFVAWTDKIQQMDPSNENDPKLYEAAYYTLPAGSRGSPKDIERLRLAYKEQVGAFQQSDLVRLAARNRNAIQFEPQGLNDWEQKPTEITCTLAATVNSPEGEHQLLIPMRAITDDKTKERLWQITLPSDGYIKQRNRTRYGWMVEHLLATGQAYTEEFVARMSLPGDTAMIGYLGFVHPDWDVRTGLEKYRQIVNVTPASGGAFGSVSLAYFPRPAGADEIMRTKVFGRPDGAPLSSEDLAKFSYLWGTQGLIAPAGAILKGNHDLHPTIIMTDDKLEIRVPVELALAGKQVTPTAARGRVILRPMPPEREAEVLASLKAARAAGPEAEKLVDPPADILSRNPSWRIVRFESDLRMLVTQMAKDAPGGEIGN